MIEYTAENPAYTEGRKMTIALIKLAGICFLLWLVIYG